MKKELYFVAINRVPYMEGTKCECEKFAKEMKKKLAGRSERCSYLENNLYCGKLKKFSVFGDIKEKVIR